MEPVIYGATLLGIDARPVEVEVRIQRGRMGQFVLTGLAGTAVRESRDRVKAAINASGFRFPRRSLLVHLAPGDLRKEGNLLDLPIALGVMAAAGEFPIERLQRFVAVGELGLAGQVRPVRGLLPIAHAGRELGVDGLIAPERGAGLAALVEGLPVYPVASLAEAVGFLSGRLDLDRAVPDPAPRVEDDSLDLVDVRGQEEAKQALALCAAGRHNLLLVGPPGCGKTMLARRLGRLLPELSREQTIACSRIRSAIDSEPTGPLTHPPFRAPHHTTSPVALVGGGPHLRPGEVTLAHHGVLFLDELPEFPRHSIESLRQPLEDRVVTITRAAGSVTLPADVCLVAAMNPCPCGYRGHPSVPCSCPDATVHRYASRVSGPMLDRIDLRVEVPAVDPRDLLERPPGLRTEDLRDRIRRARSRQAQRYGTDAAAVNARVAPRDLERSCQLEPSAESLLVRAAARRQLSARAVMRVLRISRTAADLDDCERVSSAHVALALSFRPNRADSTH